MISQLREIYGYREMIWMLVRRDLRGRYKGSALGFLWTFLNPLLQLGVYTVVFSIIMRAGIEKYYLFLFVALIPWIAMAASVANGSICITTQSNLVTKIYFPREVLPITAVTTNFVNMALCMVVVVSVCALSVGLNLRILWYLIPTFCIEYILALGIALLVSCLTVYFRDLEHILTEETESSIVRIAQLGGRAGIHLFITASPSDVTPLMNVNFDTRLDFIETGKMLFHKREWGAKDHVLYSFWADPEIARMVLGEPDTWGLKE